jgi:hypothetical protein
MLRSGTDSPFRVKGSHCAIGSIVIVRLGVIGQIAVTKDESSDAAFTV